jgi:hypothetical protein
VRSLDVPRELAQFTTTLLQADRRRRGGRPGQPGADLLLAGSAGLRWFRDRTAPDALARDHGISRATAYRCLEEVTEVLADQGPTCAGRRNGPKQQG